MKKFFFLSLILLSLLGTVKEVIACDPGWTCYALYMQYDPYTNCHYDIEFCYKCSPTGLSDTDIKVTKITAHCSNTPHPDWLRDLLLDKLATLCAIPNCVNPNTWLLVTIETPLCWEWHQRCWLVSTSPDVYDYFNWLETCNDGALCVFTSEICIDNGIVYRKNDIKQQVGSCPFDNSTSPYPSTGPACLDDECEDHVFPECIEIRPCI